MNQILLTPKGKAILTDGSTLQSDYWIGFYGLAYVPSPVIPDGGPMALIGAGEDGDYIFNIWQGDMTSTGFAEGTFTGLTLYDKNITSNYRYVYDPENLCNRLVTWSTSESSPYGRNAFRIYEGVKRTDDGTGNSGTTEASQIPMPAPLFYCGSRFSFNTPDDFDLNNVPAAKDSAVVPAGVPLVTPDMRNYPGDAIDLDPEGPYTEPVQPGTPDKYSSVASDDESRTRDGDPKLLADQYNGLLSISHYNKTHGHVSSEGFPVDYQEVCHNMSRATRLFPISSYKVNSVSETEDPETEGVAKAKTLEYKIDIDIRNTAPLANLEFPKDDTVYNGKTACSFKFNRIGIYAVPVSLHRFAKEGDSGTVCSDSHVQVEISPDAEPVLFAVALVDEMVMSADGKLGSNRYQMDFKLNLLDASGDCALVRDVDVYYNMYENQAITWYQNQLLATAGMSEAITSLGIDVAYLKNRSASSNTPLVIENNTNGDGFGGTGLKHLFDAVNPGSLRGIDAAPEEGGYRVGEYSTVIGKSSSASGLYSFVYGDYVNSEANNTAVVGGGSSISPGVSYSIMTVGGEQFNADAATLMLAACASGTYTIGNASSDIVVGGGTTGSIHNFLRSMVIADGTEIDVEDYLGASIVMGSGLRVKPSSLGEVQQTGMKNSIEQSYLTGSGTKFYGSLSCSIVLSGGVQEVGVWNPGYGELRNMGGGYTWIPDTRSGKKITNTIALCNGGYNSGVGYGSANSIILGNNNFALGGKSGNNVIIGSDNWHPDDNMLDGYLGEDSCKYYKYKYFTADTAEANIRFNPDDPDYKYWISPVAGKTSLTLRISDTASQTIPISDTDPTSYITCWQSGDSYQWGYGYPLSEKPIYAALMQPPANINNTVIVGDKNLFASGTTNSVVVGSRIHAQGLRLEDSMIFGSDMVFGFPSPSDGLPKFSPTIVKTFKNVKIFGLPKTNYLETDSDGKVISNEWYRCPIGCFSDSPKSTYSDSLIFFNDTYRSSTDVSSADHSAGTVDVFIGTLARNTYSPVYWAFGGSSSGWQGEYNNNGERVSASDVPPTDSMVYIAQPKPDYPMIYTGGIALAGPATSWNNSSIDGYGLLKLGSAYGSAYIQTAITSMIDANGEYTGAHRFDLALRNIDDIGKAHGMNWDAENPGPNIYPVLQMPGITRSGYGGHTLVVDNVQEPDGTFHIKLGDPVRSEVYKQVEVTAASDGDTVDLSGYDNCYVQLNTVGGNSSMYISGPRRAGIRLYVDTSKSAYIGVKPVMCNFDWSSDAQYNISGHGCVRLESVSVTYETTTGWKEGSAKWLITMF